jgi:hypothetical protein
LDSLPRKYDRYSARQLEAYYTGRPVSRRSSVVAAYPAGEVFLLWLSWLVAVLLGLAFPLFLAAWAALEGAPGVGVAALILLACGAAFLIPDAAGLQPWRLVTHAEATAERFLVSTQIGRTVEIPWADVAEIQEWYGAVDIYGFTKMHGALVRVRSGGEFWLTERLSPYGDLLAAIWSNARGAEWTVKRQPWWNPAKFPEREESQRFQFPGRDGDGPRRKSRG